jgi:hypothetical protein
MTVDKLEIFADYSQFYLCDPAHIEDWSALWNEQAIADRLIAMTTTVVFGTDRSFTVPVHLHRSDDTPDIDALAVQADHAVVASIACLSGTLKVIGCTAYEPDAFGIAIPIGIYGVLFCAHNLDRINGLDGDDRYDIHLWPATVRPTTRVLRRYPSR